MIDLTKIEKKWILLCKNNFTEDLPVTEDGKWITRIKPYFKEVYMWSPYDFHEDFLECLIHKLLSILRKISCNEKEDLKDILLINAGVKKEYMDEPDLKIRAIMAIKSKIWDNEVYKNGEKRYELN